MRFLPKAPLDESESLEDVGQESLGVDDVIKVTGERLPEHEKPESMEPPLDDT